MSTSPPVPSPEDPLLIVSNIAPIKQTFYLVTKETLDSYASAEHLSNIFLTICGICFGGFMSCWVGLVTSSVSDQVKMAVGTAKWGLFGFGIIFLLLSIYFVWRKRSVRDSIFRLPKSTTITPR